MSRSQETFTTVRVEGAILPVDLLQRVAAGDPNLEGLRSEDYDLTAEKVNEATSHAWNHLLPIWENFKSACETLPAGDPGRGLTLKKWLLPLWKDLHYGQLEPAKPATVGDKAYPVSHFRYHSPIHLVGLRQDLDKRVETAQGKRPSPHGMVQEFLNRSEAHLWGFVSNGLRLRILRDNIRLTRQAYVEFDLQAMFDGKVYSDFALLWRLCHESRVNAERPERCWLERWSKVAAEQGLRALDQLRDGVHDAIEALGRGFLHPSNQALISKLRSGTLGALDYYRQLLRVVYRLLLLFVAEDRDQLFDPQAGEAARERYTEYYSTARLRRIADHLRGTEHPDLYHGLSLVLDRLGTSGCPELGLPALGGLFDPASTPDLAGCRIANADLLQAVRALSVVEDGRSRSRRPVDYRNLGSEELGSVYESLLELHPQFTPDPPTFALKSASGHDRKTTGSYYTPRALISCLLDSALEPVLEEAAARPDPEGTLLGLKVCDPACGSGHFLIAAAHRIAKRLASVRTHEEEPAPEAVRHALRDVIGRCVYGVDLNPMAVELCRVALWMEALEPGKALTFLTHHIQCGNSLLGTTPALMREGIPDEAFQPIERDDKVYCRGFKKTNKQQREDTRLNQDLFAFRPWERLGDLAAAVIAIDELPGDTAEQVRAKEERYARLVSESSYRTSGRFLADLWCAAFVWKKTQQFDFPITERIFRQAEKSPHDVPPWMYDEVRRLAGQCGFLHWHLAFPSVFRPPATGETPDNELTGWCGGFDVVLGNPPWERIKLQEQEWFAAHGRPDIAGARTAAIRRRMIAELTTVEGKTEERRRNDEALHEAFLDARRQAEGESHLIRDVGGVDRETGRRWGMYPLCGRGDVNTYSVFAELNRNLINPVGRVGCVVPSGIATDDTTKGFFQDLVETGSLVSLLSFFEIRLIFPDTDSRNPFCLLTLGGSGRPVSAAVFVFDARSPEDLTDTSKRFQLSSDDLVLLNPNTRTCPVFSSGRDAVLTKAIYRRVPVLIREGPPEVNPWGVRFMAMLHMANDSSLFHTAGDLQADGWELDGSIFRKDGAACLPLYEAKMLHQFDHRWATYDGTKSRDLSVEEKTDSHRLARPRYWVAAQEVGERLKDRWDRGWLLGWRDVCRNTDKRTMISAVLSRSGVGDKFLLMLPNTEPQSTVGLLSSLNAFVFDYATRQKLGGTALKYFVTKQLPVLPPSVYAEPAPWTGGKPVADWLLPRVMELTYTAWDLQPFAADCGFDGPPFRWDEGRRFQLRCELDAAFLHLYLGTGEWRQAANEPDADFAALKEAFPTPRHAAEYILDTFPVVRQADEQKHQSYRTKEQILAVYDALAEAGRTGKPYRTLLDPPPADPRVAHPAKKMAPPPSRRDLQRRQAVAYIVLLLRTWEKPVTRSALEPALVLMLNDGVRHAILQNGSAPKPNEDRQGSFEYVRGLDALLTEMEVGRFIAHDTVRGQQVFRLGPQAPPTDKAPAEDLQRVRETLRALEILGEDRASVELHEIVNETYELLP